MWGVFVFDQFPKNTGACLGFAADPLLRGFINIQSIFVFLLFISQSFSLTCPFTIAADCWLLVKL